MDYRSLALRMLENWQLHFKIGNKFFNTVKSHVMLLMCIEQNPEIFPKGISELVGVSPPRVATAIKELMADGLIVREMDDGDRRRIFIRLTPKGKEFLQDQKEEFVRGTTTLFELLGEHDAKEYVRLLEKIATIKKQGLCKKN
ncbi:MAG: MarR family transcriptional regulator [Firmicutes bacterium]|nr:MarR family transcriptional regulator [Bacillota bacterium]